jgi:hypothetical protein
MHSYRHTYATRWLGAGESVDEVAFLLGHRNEAVTRAVYVREVNDARPRAARRSRMVIEYGSALEAAAAPIEPATPPACLPRMCGACALRCNLTRAVSVFSTRRRETAASIVMFSGAPWRC